MSGCGMPNGRAEGGLNELDAQIAVRGPLVPVAHVGHREGEPVLVLHRAIFGAEGEPQGLEPGGEPVRVSRRRSCGGLPPGPWPLPPQRGGGSLALPGGASARRAQ